MASVRPTKIPGRWREGYALEFHTLSSVYIGDNEYGHPEFATTRSEVGELLYRLKNRSDASVVPEIIEAAAIFLASWNPTIEAIVPVPASRTRALQPVMLLGDALAKRLGLPFAQDWVRKTREIPELKNVYDYDERIRLLAGAHEVDRAKAEGRRVLVFDDLYRSGATVNAITETLYDQGGVSEVFALTITRTRSLR